MTRVALCAWALTLLLHPAGAWGQEVSLSTSQPRPEKVVIGGRTTITLVVAGSDAATLGTLPEVPGVVIDAAPPIIQRATGTTRASTAWTIAVQPWRLGTVAIPPFTVDAGGRTLRGRTVPISVVRDTDAERHVSLNVVTPGPSAYVGEAVAVGLRIKIDRAFLRSHVTRLFRRELDLPMQLLLPRGRLPGRWHGTPGDAPGSDTRSLALDDGIARVHVLPDVTVDGRTRAVFELRRTLLIDTAGKLTLPGAFLRYAYANRFEDDFIRGRVPVDRREGVVSASPVALEVLPLPTQGRPPAFSGGVGRFTVEAAATAGTVREGSAFAWALTVRAADGVSAVRGIEPPGGDAFGGFHVRGVIQAEGTGTRTFTYELAPLDTSVSAVPAVSLVVFDPTPPGRYVTLRTRPIPITIVPDPSRAAPKTAPPPVAEPERPSYAWIWIAAAVLLAAGGLFAAWIRRRSSLVTEIPPEQAARDRFVRDVAAGRAPAETLADYLACLLGCEPAAVIGRDVAARLVAAGVPDAQAREAADLMERLVAARYGGTDTEGHARDAAALVETIHAARHPHT